MYFLRLDFTLELREFLIVKNLSSRLQNHGTVLSLITYQALSLKYIKIGLLTNCRFFNKTVYRLVAYELWNNVPTVFAGFWD